jgi:hypothetical protein
MEELRIDFETRVKELKAQVSAKDDQVEKLILRDIEVQARIKDLLSDIEGVRRKLDRSVGEA